MVIEDRTASIRRDIMRTKPVLANLERSLLRLETEVSRRRASLVRLRADFDALEHRLQQFEGADDALAGLLGDAVDRAWTDVQRSLRSLSIQRPGLLRPLSRG